MGKINLTLLFLTIGLSMCSYRMTDLGSNEDNAWTKWKMAFEKTYKTPSEESYRKSVFKNSLITIFKLNQMNEAQYGLGPFSDLTPEEFSATKLGLKVPSSQSFQNEQQNKQNFEAIPSSWDWRTKGVVTPVKDQARCGSCWAFSTTGNLEGLYALNHQSQLLSFSEQNLVDCSFPYGNDGCDGGLPTQAISYVITSGIQLESDYPYVAVNMMCQPTYEAFTWKEVKSQVTIPKNDNDGLLAAAALGPVSVGIDATNLQYYKGGIIGDKCGKNLDHAVLVVGWGTDSGTDYWIVKNSWGDKWGEQGYFRIKRIKGVAPAPCGISQLASYATL